MKILAYVSLVFFSIFMCFGIGFGVAAIMNVSKQRAFDDTHEVFCKECCWSWSPTMKDGGEIDIIYTCSKNKERLWRKIN